MMVKRNSKRNRGILYIPPLLRYALFQLLRNCYATKRLGITNRGERNSGRNIHVGINVTLMHDSKCVNATGGGMTGLVFEKGARLRLTRAALDQLYPRRYRDKTWRDAAAGKRFVVVGWSRDGRCTRVIVEGGSPDNTPTYYTGFLEPL